MLSGSWPFVVVLTKAMGKGPFSFAKRVQPGRGGTTYKRKNIKEKISVSEEPEIASASCSVVLSNCALKIHVDCCGNNLWRTLQLRTRYQSETDATFEDLKKTFVKKSDILNLSSIKDRKIWNSDWIHNDDQKKRRRSQLIFKNCSMTQSHHARCVNELKNVLL